MDPAALGMNADAAAAIVWRAWESRSDSLLIARGDDLLVRWSSHLSGEPQPIETMSMTKSIASLGIGLLVDDGTITSIDQPVATWFPEWGGEKRGAITLRHLLTHTSGLHARPTGDIYKAPDFVRFALESDIVAAPGEIWTYNNNGANLVAGVATEAAGRPLSEQLNQRLFIPMGLGQKFWRLDDAGNTHGLAGLALSADDLYAIGKLMLQGGQWAGKQLISEAWMSESVTPTETSRGLYGLQWWTVNRKGPCLIDDGVIAAWRAGGVPEDFIDDLMPLKDLDLGKSGFHDAVREALGGTDASMERWNDMTWKRGLPDCARHLEQVGYRADGWLGQQLVVLPEYKIIAVRQKVATPNHERYGAENTDTFKDFPERVLALIAPSSED